MTSLKKLIHENTLNYYTLEKSAEATKRATIEILNSDRLDVMARYIYAKSKITGNGISWGKHCYHELIRAWSQDFKLPPPWEPGRSSMQDYWDQFNALIDSVQKKGYDPKTSVIPICDNTLVDGAHRLAACLASDITQVNTVNLSGEKQIQNYETMRKIGVDNDVLLNMVFEFIKLKPNTRLAILFPVAQSIQKQFTSKLKDNFSVDYVESFPITRNGLTNLQDFFYGQHEWWNDWHCQDFSNRRFHKINKNITVVFFQEKEDTDIRKTKDDIRALHEADTHVMHTTDTHEETIAAAEILLNMNGRDFLDFKDRSKPTAKFDNYFLKFSKLVKKQKRTDSVALDTGSVLALYGLRDIRDMDYVSSKITISSDDELIARHDEGYESVNIDIDEILYDPRNYLVYKGVKFVSIDKVMALKTTRATPKDKHDVVLIQGMKNTQILNPSIIVPRLINKSKYKTIMMFHSSRDALVRILRKNLPDDYFDRLRSMYRKIKKHFEALLTHSKNLATKPGYIHHIRWRAINGDYTHRLKYPLNDNSIIFDVGGYRGEWAEAMFENYTSSIHIFEPVQDFASALKTKFKANKKITSYDFGLGAETKALEISLQEDASSTFKTQGATTEIQIRDIVDFIDENDIKNIDLIKLNIEGAEFELLERLITSGYIEKFKNLQIQFHDFVDDAKERRARIREKLNKTHNCDWNYPFVWEGWSLKT